MVATERPQKESKMNSINEIKKYVDFKLAQWCRLNDFDYKACDAKQQLNIVVASNLKNWVAEAMSALNQ